MRPIVAVVEARPETIHEDYGRLLDLADLKAVVASSPPAVATSAAARWVPGRSTPPWQLNEVLAWSAAVGPQTADTVARVFPVGWGDSQGECPDPAWVPVLARHGAQLATPADWQGRPVRVRNQLPALARVAGQGFLAPVGLRDRPLILLPVMDLSGGWLMHGAVALAARLLVPRRRRDRRVPASEVRAEMAQLIREVLPQLGVVLDGTVWSLGQGRGTCAVGRNILLAGNDPVAVDAVALRLAGVDPLQVPWLRLATERGYGVGDPAGIRVAGNARLLDLDFGIPESTFASRPAPPAGRGRRWWSAMARLGGARRTHGAMPWAELYGDQESSSETGANR